MSDEKKSGKEALEEVLRNVAEKSAVSGLRTETERMRAALALAYLEEGDLTPAKVANPTKIINGQGCP